MTVAEIIILLLTRFPANVQQISTFYQAVKSIIPADQQAVIEQNIANIVNPPGQQQIL